MLDKYWQLMGGAETGECWPDRRKGIHEATYLRLQEQFLALDAAAFAHVFGGRSAQRLLARYLWDASRSNSQHLRAKLSLRNRLRSLPVAQF